MVLDKAGGSAGAGEFAEGLGWIGRRVLGGSAHNHSVTCVVGNAPRFRQDFQKSDGPVSLINHGMSNSPDDSDGLALSLFDAEAYFGMRDQATGFEDFSNLLFGLDFRQSGDMQANWYKGDANGPGLANAHFPAKLFYIENFEVQKVAIADDVVMRHDPRGGGHRTYAVVDLLWRFENGLLSTTGWGQNQ